MTKKTRKSNIVLFYLFTLIILSIFPTATNAQIADDVVIEKDSIPESIINDQQNKPIDFGMPSVDSTNEIPVPLKWKKEGVRIDKIDYGIVPTELVRILANQKRLGTLKKKCLQKVKQ